MARSYSIAEARDQLARLVHRAESGRAVELTRRGRPVAVLLSASEYERLVPSASFGELIDLFLERWPARGDGLRRGEVEDLRAASAGRDFDW